MFLFTIQFQLLIEAPNSVTDGARGLVDKRGDTAMRERFFSLNKKFGKTIKKTCQYILNVVPHIFTSINFLFLLRSIDILRDGIGALERS